MRSVNPYDMIHCLHSLYHIIWYTVTSQCGNVTNSFPSFPCLFLPLLILSLCPSFLCIQMGSLTLMRSIFLAVENYHDTGGWDVASLGKWPSTLPAVQRPPSDKLGLWIFDQYTRTQATLGPVSHYFGDLQLRKVGNHGNDDWSGLGYRFRGTRWEWPWVGSPFSLSWYPSLTATTFPTFLLPPSSSVPLFVSCEMAFQGITSLSIWRFPHHSEYTRKDAPEAFRLQKWQRSTGPRSYTRGARQETKLEQGLLRLIWGGFSCSICLSCAFIPGHSEGGNLQFN